MIVFKNVIKSHGDEQVLKGISFRVDPGEFVCVSGPSGAGKTTILSLIIAAERPTAGTVEVDGVDLRSVPSDALQLYRRRVGLMFQDLKLLPDQTAAENIAFPLDVCGVAEDVMEQRVRQVLREIGLSAHASALPRELSAGQRARVALGRAIAHKPMIILADEPTGNMDPLEGAGVLQLLHRLQKNGTTVIIATHDAALVDTLQTRVIRLENGTVIRDSVGGYEKAKRTQPKAVPQAKHSFFLESDEHAAERIGKPDEPPDGRKVRITSIGS